MLENRKMRIFEILNEYPNRLRSSYFIKNHLELYNEIENHVDFLELSFKEKLWYWINDIKKAFICKCGNKTTFNKNWLDGYRIYCSVKCSHSDIKTKEKRKATNLEKYGVDNVSKLDSVKNKTIETNLEKYGTKSSFQNKDVKDKWRNTVKDKYGVNHIFQLDSFKNKSKETNLKKYGKEYFTQTDEYKFKVKKTNNDKYGFDWYTKTDEYKEKTLNTNLEKYGVDHYSKTNEYKDSVKISNLKKYNKDWYFQSNDFREKTLNTNLNKYGFSHHTNNLDYKERIKLLNNFKYGFDSYMQTDEFKEKTIKINLEKYGVDHYSKTNEYKEKSIKSSMDKYGVDNYSKTDISKIKSRNKNILKYGVDNISKNEEYRHINYKISNNINYIRYLDNSISLFNCDCGELHEFEIHIDNYIKRIDINNPICVVCYPISDNSSIKERILLEFIKTIYNGEIISSYRDGFEIDIYIPQLKIGFEFNGLYWHSNMYKDKNYHLDKTNHFNDRGIRIIHIWEDDWTFNRDIIFSQIKNWLYNTNNKIFARKCKVIQLKSASKFLNENHIQGIDQSAIKLGLYYKEELVSVMTFNVFEGRKRMVNYEWNLSRFCNKLHTNVIGGASKLLNYFIKNYKPIRLISYADKDWSTGNLYYKLGFKNIGESLPDYKYIVNGKRVHKSRYSKSKTKTLLTESEYAIENNIHKIYDCGKIKFEILFLNNGL